MTHANFQELHDHVYGFKASDHVASCDECGRRADGLRAERETLARVLADESSEEEPPAPPENLLQLKPKPVGRVRRVRTGVWVGAAASVLLGVLAWIVTAPGRPSSNEHGLRPRVSRAPATYGVRSKPAGTESKPGMRPGSYKPAPPTPVRPNPQPLPPQIDVPFFQMQVVERTWHVNMRGIVAELLRLRGLESQRAEIVRKQQEDEAKIQQMLRRLTDAGAPFEAPDRMQADDQIISMGGIPIAGVPVPQGQAALGKWLRAFKPPVLTQEIQVQRGDKRVVLFIAFLRETKELLQLVRYPDTLKGGVAPSSNDIPGIAVAPASGSIPGAPAVLTLPTDVMEDIKARFELLPPGYFMLLQPADRARLTKLQKQVKGTPHDLQFLNNLKLKVLPRLESEAAYIRSQVRNLEPKVMKESTAVDVIHFKSPPGRKVQGRVIEQTATHVKIKLRFGTVKYPLTEILKVEKGGGAGAEFPDRYAKAKGNRKAMTELLGWCKDNNLKPQLEFVGYTILMEDPSNEPARKAVRRPRPVVGENESNPR